MRATLRELLDAMGNLTTDAEAEAMRDILDERGITDISRIDDAIWFNVLIPLAVERAKGVK